MGPPHPPLSEPPFPGALEGRLDPHISTWAALARSRKHGFGSESAGCWGAELQRDRAALPRRLLPGGRGGRPRQRRGCPTQLLGARGHGSPRSGMQSLLRMCVCSGVCVFICTLLFKKQPSSWGSWTLHVRVSPEPLAHCPPPRALPLFPTPSSARIALPCREKDYGKLQDSPHPAPAPACWGRLHASSRAQGSLIPISFPPFNNGEESSKPPPGSVVLPCILRFAAIWPLVGGEEVWGPGQRATPSPFWLHTAPVCRCLFDNNMLWNLPPQGFSREISFWLGVLKSQHPSAHPSPYLAGWMPTSGANNCLLICPGFTRGSSCLSPMAGTLMNLQHTPSGAGPPLETNRPSAVVRQAWCRARGQLATEGMRPGQSPSSAQASGRQGDWQPRGERVDRELLRGTGRCPL